MRVPTRRRQYGLKFDLTSLNDMVFLLIIFLIAAPHFRPSDAKDEVALPRVDINRGAETEAERRLEITVTRDGEWRIAGQMMSPDKLRTHIRAAADRYRSSPGKYELRLRCDERAKWGQVEPIVQMCVEAGFTDIKYAVLPAGAR
jgi:biopolymer transport protein ExbD